jgi:hypothetical protein
VIEIANMRDLVPVPELPWGGWSDHEAYVGRQNKRWRQKKSPLANPWGVGGDVGREAAIEFYRGHLAFYIRHDKGGVREELRRLRALHEKHGRLTLVCWCAPKRCHAEVIKEWLDGEVVS